MSQYAEVDWDAVSHVSGSSYGSSGGDEFEAAVEVRRQQVRGAAILLPSPSNHHHTHTHTHTHTHAQSQRPANLRGS